MIVVIKSTVEPGTTERLNRRYSTITVANGSDTTFATAESGVFNFSNNVNANDVTDNIVYAKRNPIDANQILFFVANESMPNNLEKYQIQEHFGDVCT